MHGAENAWHQHCQDPHGAPHFEIWTYYQSLSKGHAKLLPNLMVHRPFLRVSASQRRCNVAGLPA